MTLAKDRTSAVGRLLKQWRSVRRMSQLELALEAGVSARHVSFVETGRSGPSREMVMLLAEVLEVPHRERNALLEAAGFAPYYRESELSDPELAQVRRVIEFILERHEPYSAVAIDRRWNVLMANRSHQLMLDRLLGERSLDETTRGNLLRLTFDPDGLRSCIANWEEVARALVDRLHREIGICPDQESEALLEAVLSYPGVPERWRVPDLTRPPPVVIPIRLRANSSGASADRLELALFSAITTLGTAQDVTLQELRIESFFPADEATERVIRGLAP
ncbi:MAG: helix-turn-helix domain-containing protein [Gemmatimonadota bacterium]